MHTIRIAKELKNDRLSELLDEYGAIRVELDDLAAAPNPASTKSRIFGPALVQYVQNPHDRGIDTTILA